MSSQSQNPFGGGPESGLDPFKWYEQNRERSIFGLFPHRQVLRLLVNAQLYRCTEGAVVPRPRQPTHLIIVAEGEVGLWTRGDNPRRVGKVIAGRSLELKTLLRSAAQSWEFDWRANRDCTLIALEWGVIKNALRENPDVRAYLTGITQYPELRRLKTDLSLLGFGFEAIQKTLFVLRLQKTAEALTGTRVAAPSLVVVHRGEIGVNAEIRGTSQKVGRYRAGEFFLVDGTRELVFEPSADFQYWSVARDEWEAALGRLATGAGAAIASAQTVQSLEVAALAIEKDVAAAAEADDRPRAADDEEDDGLTVRDFTVDEKEQRRIHRRKFPHIRQHDEMDCGAACLATIARYYRHNISLPVYRSLVHVTREGASMLALKRGAEATGMQAMGVYSGFRGLLKLRTPFIALMQYHFIVVYKVTEKEVVASDPARGLVTLPAAEFQKEWSKDALLLKVTPEFHKYPRSASSFGKYAVLFREHKRELAELAGASILVTLLGLISPLFMQFIFDHVLAGGNSGVLTAGALLVITLHLLSGGLEWTRNYLLAHLRGQLDQKFSALFLAHTFKLPLGFFAVRRVGDITTRLNEIQTIREFFTGRSINTVINVLYAVLYTAVIALYSLKLLVLLAVVVPIIAVVIGAFVPKVLALLRDTYRATARNQSVTFEQFNSLESLKSINAQVAARWKWEASFAETLRLRKRLEVLAASAGGLAELFSGLTKVAVLLLAVRLYLSEELTLGQVVAVNMLAGRIVEPLIAVIAEWNQLSEVGTSLARIDDVITSAPEHEPAEGRHASHRIRGDVSFQNVSFRYGSELSPLVLDGVSLDIRAGETVALVGPSGSGKTTLAYMVNLLYAPTNGRVLVDGIDTTEIPLTTLRRQIAMITQENHLFSGTILENITMGDPTPSFQRAMQAALAADAHGFIASMPDGYATRLGEGGGKMSGGQKQRVNIARALYRDPRILIMDEGTAALDAMSEKTILENIRSGDRKRTTIMIAHRLNTVMSADRIVVFRSGRIIENGTHGELLARRGHYATLFNKQLHL